MIILLLFFLLKSFSSGNIFSFYFWFERTLLPITFIIIGWGYQPERLQAGYYLLFYTLFGSLPLLLIFLYLFEYIDVIDFFSFYYNDIENFKNLIKGKSSIDVTIFYFFIIFGFLIKIPIYLFHLWLPKAHVEAPVAGSIILAGVLLKLGGYGLIRCFFIIIFIAVKFNWVFIIIRLIGGMFVSLICLRQIDLKSLIAYSSIAHIRLVIGGLFILTNLGISISLILIIAHGLCSSGLFFLVNIIYERLNSRSIFINKGLINLIPRISIWWFLFCAGNIAAPPTLNLLGEIGLLRVILNWSSLMIVILITISFFSAAYSLFLFSLSQHGKLNFINFRFFNCNVREFLILFLHWFPINFLILKREIFLL